jgi:hypothetical protein
MENIISKWKKIMKNEKKNTDEDNLNITEVSSPKSIRSSKNLLSSQMSVRSEKSILSTNKKNSSKDNSLQRSSSSQHKSSPKNNLLKKIAEEDGDKLLSILNRTINYIQKTQESCNIKTILEYLNEAIEIHIQNYNNKKLIQRKFDEKEIIWSSKCDTGEKIIKDLELKVLSLEKEKVKKFNCLDKIKEAN